jgi:hypothetical protein
MTLLRAVARPMLASMFVVGGAMALKDPGPRAAKAQPTADLIKRLSPGLPVNGSNLTRVNGGVQLVAGLALATGRFPRTSALALAATLHAHDGRRAPVLERDRSRRPHQPAHPLLEEPVDDGRAADGDARPRSAQEVHRPSRQGQGLRRSELGSRPARPPPPLTPATALRR